MFRSPFFFFLFLFFHLACLPAQAGYFFRQRRIPLYGILFALFFIFPSSIQASEVTFPPTWWEFQSIDTMKYSRDPSREFLDNPERAEEVIKQQTTAIAATGATHIGIATPYDEEFLPVLRLWVGEARKNGLNIWFRGNWSGWEQWFGYDKITREEHLEKTVQFIIDNPDLFQEGDYFSACPECENGGPGDPRLNGDAEGHKQFLIDEYKAIQKAFRSINRNVNATLNSMNGDVARLIMDRETTNALGGTVVIDHYVSTPQKLADDIVAISEQSGGKVILGEFGAPIPDIHGKMTEQQQSEWLEEALTLFAELQELDGINYWTSFGGSTELWDSKGNEKEGVRVLRNFYIPEVASGQVLDPFGGPVESVQVWSQEKKVSTDVDGVFQLPYVKTHGNVVFTVSGYEDTVLSFDDLLKNEPTTITLSLEDASFWERFKLFLKSLFL